jgi:hypothetical protein
MHAHNSFIKFSGFGVSNTLIQRQACCPMDLFSCFAAGEVSAGIKVQPSLHARDEHGKLKKGEPFTHFAVLGAVYADSPARAKLMYTLSSWTAYLACAFCKLTGTMKNKVVRYLGYAEPVPTTQGVGRGKSYQMGQPDGRLMTEREVKAQAIAAEYYRARGFEPPPGNRFKGFSPLLRRLYYVNPVRLWVIPFCHAFYLGVFKDFLKLATAKKSKVRGVWSVSMPAG